MSNRLLSLFVGDASYGQSTSTAPTPSANYLGDSPQLNRCLFLPLEEPRSTGGLRIRSTLPRAEGKMNDHGYYHSYLNRDRLIHIVDADPAICEALSVLFRLEGFQTVFSLEASHFSVSLERRRPDIVVLNLTVGGESGLGLLRRVKAMRTGT